MFIMKTLFLLIFPGGVLFAAVLYLQFNVSIPPSWQPLASFFPIVAVIVGVLLGWRFNRTRMLWVILLLVLSERALTFATPYGRECLLAVTPVLIPLNLLLFCWWSERGLFTLHGLSRMAILTAEVGGLAWLYLYRAGETIAFVERPLVTTIPLPNLPFSQLSLLIILFCAAGLLLRFFKKPEALESSFFWTLWFVLVGLAWPDDFALWGGFAVFLMVTALVESSFSMAFNDELTGLPARRAMNEYLLKVGRRYTVAMVDVDHFKKVNDTHGHDIGDQVLRMVATCLRRVTGGGRAYRYGGEEFVVIFPSKDLKRALPHLEELREAIAQAGFLIRGRKRPKQKPETLTSKKSDSAKLQVTVSIGAATRDDNNTTSEQLLKAADKALYQAKKTGRNRVCS